MTTTGGTFRSRGSRLAMVALLAGVAASGCQSAPSPLERPVERVLVVSLPGVSWADVRAGSLPTLAALGDAAAVANLSTRIGRRGASTTDAYLSMGAGTRALAPRVDVAVALDAGESYGGVPTEDILRRRLGRVPPGVAYLAVGAATDRNETSGFGAKPGRLGDLLAAARVSRAVVANADAAEGFVSDEPPPDGAYARGAATVLMGSDGIVPGGTVGRGLLVDDPTAPFGRRLDQAAVLRAVDDAWATGDRAVVLVEASDLSRATGYTARATPDQSDALRRDALARSDSLLRALMTRVDPARDAVLVVSPVAPAGAPELGVVLLRAPGVDAGLLRSSTTRRDGYVQLADIAPTVLRLLGEPAPDEIEGRPIDVRPGIGGDRFARLAEEAGAARFRDDLMVVVVPTVIGALAVLLTSSLLALRWHRSWRTPLRIGALTGLGVVPATFAASRFSSLEGSITGYLAVTAALALVIGLVLWFADRRWPRSGALAGTAAIVSLFTVDVLAGAPLQVNAVFGYSVAVAGRFAGVGNLAFALFSAASVLLAVLIVDRFGDRSLPWAVGLLVAVVLLEGLPMLGADVGGVLSMVPAFGISALVLAGRQPRLRHLTALLGVAAASVLVFAFVDLARPAGSQTHLARLAEHLLDARWGPFSDSLTRRLQASFGAAEVAAWGFVAALGMVVGAYVALVARGRLSPDLSVGGRRRPTVAAIAGLVVLAVVGLVANDSSIAVPSTMLIVAVPVLVLRLHDETPSTGGVDMDPA